MKKYKICPECNEHNIPSMIECTNCEADLSSVPISIDDTSKENNMEYFPFPEERKSTNAVRICECGTENPFQARKCTNCGEDISDIIAQIVSPECSNSKTQFFITSIDKQVSLQIYKTIVIGRETALHEYLNDKKYVSRSHASFTIENNRLMIENLSYKNYTYVNNIKIPDGKYELHNGDEIGLGGKVLNGERQEYAGYFIVEVK